MISHPHPDSHVNKEARPWIPRAVTHVVLLCIVLLVAALPALSVTPHPVKAKALQAQWDMARAHADQMAKLKFADHTHPKDKSRRTVRDRARRVGYKDADGECIASGSGGHTPVWLWRSDTGHHRGMSSDWPGKWGWGLWPKRS